MLSRRSSASFAIYHTIEEAGLSPASCFVRRTTRSDWHYLWLWTELDPMEYHRTTLWLSLTYPATPGRFGTINECSRNRKIRTYSQFEQSRQFLTSSSFSSISRTDNAIAVSISDYVVAVIVNQWIKDSEIRIPTFFKHWFHLRRFLYSLPGCDQSDRILELVIQRLSGGDWSDFRWQNLTSSVEWTRAAWPWNTHLS